VFEASLTGCKGGRNEIGAVMSNGFGIEEVSDLSSNEVTTPQLSSMYSMLHVDKLSHISNV
jgi:hypothetical protein